MDRLKGKVAIITGGNSGVGAATAALFAREGAKVVISARRQAQLEEVAAKIRAEGGEVLPVVCDISKHEDARHLVAETIKAYGKADILVNNAGVLDEGLKAIDKVEDDVISRVVDINTKGTMFMTQLVAKRMLQQEIKGRRRGVIVNISSSSVTVSSTNRGEYCVSKAGLAMLTTLYADRLAASDIQVYEIRPGVIDTDMTKVVHQKYSDLIEQGAFPIARWGTPQDIADAVSAFCTEKFIYSTGNYIDIDGGFHIKKL